MNFDANGDLWLAYSGVPANSGGAIVNGLGIINEISPTGQMMIPPVSTVTVPSYTLTYNSQSTTSTTPVTTTYSITGATYNLFTLSGVNGCTSTGGSGRISSLALDTAGNAWYSGYYPDSATCGSEISLTGTPALTAAVLAEVKPSETTGVGVGYFGPYSSAALAIDAANDVITSGEPAGFTGNIFTAASGYQTVYEGAPGPYANLANVVVLDNHGYIFLAESRANPAELYQENFTDGTAEGALGTCTQGVSGYCKDNIINIDASGAAGIGVLEGAAYDSHGNLWGQNSATPGGLSYLDFNIGGTKTAPVVTAIPGSATTTAPGPGGLYSVSSDTAIDGKGNVWNGDGQGGWNEYYVGTPTASGVPYIPLSPQQVAVYGFNAFGLTPKEAVIDSSGNLWASYGTASILHMVGAAAPVITPKAAQVYNPATGTAGTIGTEP